MNYPRVLVHEGLTGGGSPLIVAGKLDPIVRDKIARFGLWCCQPGYLWSSQRFALESIRASNPTIKILVHFVHHSVWGTPSTNADDYQGRYAAICDQPNGKYPGTNRPNLCDKFIRADTIDLWHEVIARGGYDGVMIDPMCAVSGLPATVEQQRAALGEILIVLRLRHPDKIIIGCGGPRGDYTGGDQASGWWQENFPDQNPVGWSPVTRLCMDAAHHYRPPVFQVIATARESLDAQAARFGLGTSCLFDGVHMMGPGDPKYAVQLDWWIPQYGPAGWLGQPIGAPWPIAGGWIREFEHGSVIVDVVARDAVFTRRDS